MKPVELKPLEGEHPLPGPHEIYDAPCSCARLVASVVGTVDQLRNFGRDALSAENRSPG